MRRGLKSFKCPAVRFGVRRSKERPDEKGTEIRYVTSGGAAGSAGVRNAPMRRGLKCVSIGRCRRDVRE